tara:strand:+ start:376 stop:540 length:165 start_codon:yes stop_codon:yes gene_type:complete
MSRCQLCKKEVDERSTQDQIGFELCLSCAYNYSDKSLLEIMKEKVEIMKEKEEL